MFGVGGTELMVVLFIALLLFGPQKLPEIARQIGKVMGEARRIMDDTVRTIQDEPKLHPSPNEPTKPYMPENSLGTTQETEKEKKEGDNG